jgi:hypothetical protein
MPQVYSIRAPTPSKRSEKCDVGFARSQIHACRSQALQAEEAQQPRDPGVQVNTELASRLAGYAAGGWRRGRSGARRSHSIGRRIGDRRAHLARERQPYPREHPAISFNLPLRGVWQRRVDDVAPGETPGLLRMKFSAKTSNPAPGLLLKC